MPLSAAGIPGCTSPTTGGRYGLTPRLHTCSVSPKTFRTGVLRGAIVTSRRWPSRSTVRVSGRPGRGGVDRVLPVRLFAHHLHVAAEGDDRDAVFRLAAANGPQPRPEAEGEPLDPDPDRLGDEEVSQLVDEDERPQGDDGA